MPCGFRLIHAVSPAFLWGMTRGAGELGGIHFNSVELVLLLGGILSASGRGKLRTQNQEVLEELRVAFLCAAVTSAPSLYPRQEF